MNDPSMRQGSASGEKQKLSNSLLLGETSTIFRVLGDVPKASQCRQDCVTEQRCVQAMASPPWRLCIYVQSFNAEGTFSTHLTSSEQQTQSCLRSLATHSPHWHQNVFPTREAGGRKSKSGLLSFSPNWPSAAAASVLPTVLYSAFFRRFYGLHCFAKQKKTWEQNRRQTTSTMKKCQAVVPPAQNRRR